MYSRLEIRYRCGNRIAKAVRFLAELLRHFIARQLSKLALNLLGCGHPDHGNFGTTD
jgi:hypothetical protein